MKPTTRFTTKHARGGSTGRTAGAALLAAALLAATACGIGRGPEDGQPRPNYRDNPVTLEVENRAWATMHVYVVSGGQWESLGQVTSQTTDSYELSSTIMGTSDEIRLAADPVGSTRAYLSDPVLVRPGDRVSWTLQNNLSMSSVMVR